MRSERGPGANSDGPAAQRLFAEGSGIYRDRVDAGRTLGACLEQYRETGALVLGIPRGGVPVAAEVARMLDAELDVIVARKLGAPGQRELAIGAVTSNGGKFLDENAIRGIGVTEQYLAKVIEAEMAEAHRREYEFRAGRRPARIENRVVIIVDDGLATGATMRASVKSVRSREPAKLVVAVPVGSREACAALKQEADEVVCPYQPVLFWAVGYHYENFEPTLDHDVLEILRQFHGESVDAK